MAGESPDRSKQRESSAEPTSGSAGPVPEARGEARSEGEGGAGREARDPRLALAGESDEAGTSDRPRTSASGASGGRGGVDTATRVLSMRDVVTETEESEASGESGTDGKDGRAGDDRESGDGEAAGEKAESAGSAESGKPVAGDEESEAEDGKSAAGKGEGEEAEGTKSGAEKPGAEKPGAEKSEGGKPAPGPEAESQSEPDPRSAPESKSADAKAESKPDPKAESKPADAKGESKADPKAESKAADLKTDPKGAPKTAAPTAEPEGKPKADAPVDQPTAVFKAPKPAVDQPTTMLKLGGGSKNDAKAGPKRVPGSDESDAERTSKFVALKPLDAPETRKPQPKPQQAQPTQQPPARPQSPSQPKPQPGAQAAVPSADAVDAVDATAPVPQAGPERTTQQPLPPKPPLDLLAELTNTPPPPQTPLRTLLRRIKIWTPLVVLLAIIFAIVQALRPLPSPALALSAEDTFTFDGAKATLPWPNEGQGWMDVDGIGTMGHFGKQTPVAIGSVAKTMTAYIVLRDHPLKPGQEGPKIKVDATAEKEGSYDKSGGESTLNTVKAGDYLTEKQALSAVMIPSANNIARLLARWDAGSEAAFVKKMNATAKELGMTGTTYTDPSGLTKTTVSTAEDQVKLGRAVVKIPALVAITSAASWTDPSGRNWPNYNQLPYTMGAIGIKTGTTTAAGGNLLFAARKEVGGQTVTVVGAILGQHQGPSILDTVNAVSSTALKAAKEALTSSKILKKGDVVGYVDDRLGGHTPVVVTKDVTAVGWSGLRVELSLTGGDLPHSAKAGTKVGTLTVGDGSRGAVQVPVALQTDLTEPGFTDKLTRLG
ncbi:D-alanyl-D-alanine carboxypeptidase [Streptomyces mexicanus]